MAGLFGWSGNTTSADNDEARRILAKMCGADAFSTETHRDAAVAVASPDSAGSVARTEDLLTVIAGMPVWRDADLAATAKQDGNAAALAKAYRKDGLDVFKQIGGAFSLAILDHRSGRVVAAVDRMGIGRMYYACPSQGGIVFGTSADGSVVVGRSDFNVGAEAFIWDTTNGMQPLAGVLGDGYGERDP